MKHAFFVLYTFCVLICMYVSLKSHWGGRNIRISEVLVPTFIKEPFHLGVGGSVCSS